MKINGHLQDFSLQELLKILTNLRESGCLTIDFQPEPAVFYFSRGQLVEGRLLETKGQDAISLAFSLPNASFQFDDDVEIPESVTLPAEPDAEPRPEGLRLSIETAEPVARTQTSIASAPVASDVLTATQSDSTADDGNGVSVAPEPVPGPKDIQFIHPQQSFSYIKRQRIITAAVAILLIGVPAAVGVTVHFRTKSETPSATAAEEPDSQSSAASSSHEDDKSAGAQEADSTTSSEPSPSPSPKKDDPIAKESADADTPRIISEAADDARRRAQPDKAADAHVKRPPTEAKTILVMVQVTDGRVTEAWVKDPRKGSEAVEAAAVRMARQRHYPPNISLTETVAISVTVNH